MNAAKPPDMALLLTMFENNFPPETWSYGFSSPDPVKHTALAWLTNRQPSHLGFDNQPNKAVRYYAATAPTIREAAIDVLRRALERKAHDDALAP